VRAIANARHLCDVHLAGRGDLSVIDVHVDLDAFLASGIIATPTLHLELTETASIELRPVDEEDDRIVAAVVDLAANLGLRSIAEGVETTDQLERLRELGCDEAQGYLCARPMPPSEVGAVMHSAW
jgi:c-di-GMP-related signal transduction protein